MPSLFQQALGADFAKLHPQMQRRFGISSRDQLAVVGRGVMKRIWLKGSWLRPFLAVASRRHLLVPRAGERIPFMIENYAYTDSFGRETLTFARTFQFADRKVHFDATMIYSEARQSVVDYLGLHQDIAADILLSVEPNGGLRLRSGAQRLVGWGASMPLPAVCTGHADVCEWYSEEEGCFKVEVRVSHPLIGEMFTYEGSFQAEYMDVRPDQVPERVKPKRESRRE
ncbi:DUF4166 domain-containing protein [Laceyella putida]|uniref:DUF4166 domain-containing protein n=1 Tax=Laceyella putida TaxID=110101 RepID=A0ABW2RLS9_9BACL